MSATWVQDIEASVFTKIKGKTYKAIHDSYSTVKYTTNNSVVEPITVFPTIYIHELTSIPQGSNLEADKINGVLSTFEVRVTTNTNKNDTKEIMGYVLDAFVSLRFIPTSNPIYSSENNMFIANARFRRSIGSDDVL